MNSIESQFRAYCQDFDLKYQDLNLDRALPEQHLFELDLIYSVECILSHLKNFKNASGMVAYEERYREQHDRYHRARLYLEMNQKQTLPRLQAYLLKLIADGNNLLSNAEKEEIGRGRDSLLRAALEKHREALSYYERLVEKDLSIDQTSKVIRQIQTFRRIETRIEDMLDSVSGFGGLM